VQARAGEVDDAAGLLTCAMSFATSRPGRVVDAALDAETARPGSHVRKERGRVPADVAEALDRDGGALRSADGLRRLAHAVRDAALVASRGPRSRRCPPACPNDGGHA